MLIWINSKWVSVTSMQQGGSRVVRGQQAPFAHPWVTSSPYGGVSKQRTLRLKSQHCQLSWGLNSKQVRGTNPPKCQVMLNRHFQTHVTRANVYNSYSGSLLFPNPEFTFMTGYLGDEQTRGTLSRQGFCYKMFVHRAVKCWHEQG